MAQGLLAQINLHALHGIELRRVGRQKHKADVLRYTQPPRRVPSRLVKDQHRMRVRGQAFENSWRKTLITAAVANGITSANASSVPARTAPKR
jgi:hypothetical protein